MKKKIDYRIPSEPKTYEEAVRILRESHHDEMHKQARRGVYLRAGIAVGIGIVASLITGLVNHEFSMTPYIMVTAATVGMAFLMPLLDLRAIRKSYEKGEVFKEHTPDEVIEEAKNYIKIYTEYLEDKTK